MKQKVNDIETQLIQAICESEMNLGKLAIMSGVDHAMIYRLVHRQRSVTLPTAAKLAKALGLELHKAEEE